jgi:hypothetical protein
MLRTAFEMAIVGAMVVCPFLGLSYSCIQWKAVFQNEGLPRWHPTLGITGLLAVTAQAVLFIALWTPISRYHAFVQCVLSIELFLFFLAVLSMFAWKGKARWWLLASSLFLLADSFFSALAELAY